ncbi:MAG: 2-C-methyl-D-erythritol 4-phosphate cytidylyltransferase [Thermoleophilia bacterium]
MSGVWAVVVAAGKGERLGHELPKAFVRLTGRPLLAESLERLDESEWIEGIVVVCPDEWEEPTILLAEELGLGKVAAAVVGGATRAESVRLGVAEVPDEAAVILVHDAARPFLSDAVIERVVLGLGDGYDGAVPGLSVADTIKRVDAGGAIVETVDRSALRAVQTPQGFVASTFRRALASADPAATDCASVLEAAGCRVRVVDGDPQLLKVTTPDDLERARAILRAQGRDVDEPDWSGDDDEAWEDDDEPPGDG